MINKNNIKFSFMFLMTVFSPLILTIPFIIYHIHNPVANGGEIAVHLTTVGAVFITPFFGTWLIVNS
jgi:hypothetical protein